MWVDCSGWGHVHQTTPLKRTRDAFGYTQVSRGPITHHPPTSEVLNPKPWLAPVTMQTFPVSCRVITLQGMRVVGGACAVCGGGKGREECWEGWAGGGRKVPVVKTFCRSKVAILPKVFCASENEGQGA